MKAWPTLLRVVLGIALILNGIGGAVAGTLMHMQAAALAAPAGTPAEKATGQAGMPCHAHQGHQDHHVGGQQAPEAGSPASPGKPTAPDGCKSGTCTCACAHIAPIALSALRVAAPVLAHGLAVQRLSLAHAAPVLPHMIRPPIG